jgi:TonB family protein
VNAINEVILAVSASTALATTVKATFALSLGLAAAALARGGRAAARHAILAGTFTAIAALPLVSLVAPPVPIAVRLARAASPNPLPKTPQAPIVTYPAGKAPVAPVPRYSTADLLLAAWAAAAALFLIPVAAGLWQIAKLRRTAVPWIAGQPTVDRLARAAGIERYVDLLLHESLPGPMTCGARRPAIVLPADAPEWPVEDVERAIVHELEHVRRRDWVTHCAARAICAVYWFHPLAWMTWRRLELEAERACDDAVLGHSEATAYADQLVAVARRLSAGARQPVLAMASRADLSARVSAVLDGRQQRGRVGTRLVTAAAIAVAFVVAAVSPLRVVAAPQEPATARPAFRSESALVMLDATVKYPGGGTIEGLTANDFILTEDDRPERISVFEVHQVDGQGHYLLGYYARPSTDGAFRKIKIGVKSASTAVIDYRVGYFGPKRPEPSPEASVSSHSAPIAKLDPGVSPPALLYKKEPEYSEAARKAKYQGTVLLDLEVTPMDETPRMAQPTDIKISRSLGLGLDEKAIEAVKQWRFKPAFKDGKPIAMRITTEVVFRLL